MTDDPIKAALEAACATDGFWSWDAKTDRDIMQDRAAAIAAFLRALPQCSVMLAADSGWHNTVTLAAAVERAAREGGG